MERELYFKRNKAQEESLNLYQYDGFPKAFRVQVFHILADVFYSPEDLEVRSLRGDVRINISSGDLQKFLLNIDEEMSTVCKQFSREKGRLSIKGPTNKVSTKSSYQSILEFFISEQDTDDFLTILEMVCNVVENKTSEFDFGKREDAYVISKKAIDELNQRFYEHNIGYQYENGQIVRVDSEFIHTESVHPALQLLSNPLYKGAQEEFLKAHEHYRHGRYDSALSDCLKAFESTMKIILDKHGWEYDKNRDTASRLINCCIRNELIPKFWTDHFTSLNNMLASSIPTPRNKLSGHGKGNKTVEVPEHLIQYVLHMTASTIVFLVKAEETLN
ncbi:MULTISPECIES: STM4504/CBY_0614 family protein [Psychrobacter]|uniref:STM4504/CBY_0614 family protein n=1 Tax=Psychrobacter TaxID=497 RepID=UPI00191811A4|nr:hypothetical protein [Psychrobacter nivimaris]